jgi:hypothetical protein
MNNHEFDKVNWEWEWERKEKRKVKRGRWRKEVENLVPDWQEEVEHKDIGELHERIRALTLYSYPELSRHLRNIREGNENNLYITKWWSLLGQSAALIQSTLINTNDPNTAAWGHTEGIIFSLAATVSNNCHEASILVPNTNSFPWFFKVTRR